MQLQLCAPNGDLVEIIELCDHENIIGRLSPSTHTIASQYVSKVHAIMRFNGQLWTIKDLKSNNGTFVNAVKLQAYVSTELQVGDLIGFGMPATCMNRKDGTVYRVCRKASANDVAEGSSAPKQRPVQKNIVKQEMLVADEAVPSTSSCIQGEAKVSHDSHVHIEAAKQRPPLPRLPPIRELSIRVQRCDEPNFTVTGFKRSATTGDDDDDTDNVWRAVHSDSQESDYEVSAPKTSRVILSDDSDVDSSRILRKLKVVSPKRKRPNVPLVIDLSSDEDDDVDVKDDNLVNSYPEVKASNAASMYEQVYEEQPADGHGHFDGFSQNDVVITISDDDEDEMPASYERYVKQEVKCDPMDDVLQSLDNEWSLVIDVEDDDDDEDVDVAKGQPVQPEDDVETLVAMLHGEGVAPPMVSPIASTSAEPDKENDAKDEEESSSSSDEDISEMDDEQFFPEDSAFCSESEDEPAATAMETSNLVPDVPGTSGASQHVLFVPAARKQMHCGGYQQSVDRLKASSKNPDMTLLTKAQPMPVGRRCGPRRSVNDMFKCPTVASPTKTATAAPALPTTTRKTSNSTPAKKTQQQSLMQKTLREFNNRVPMPGGGSDSKFKGSPEKNTATDDARHVPQKRNSSDEENHRRPAAERPVAAAAAAVGVAVRAADERRGPTTLQHRRESRSDLITRDILISSEQSSRPARSDHHHHHHHQQVHGPPKIVESQSRPRSHVPSQKKPASLPPQSTPQRQYSQVTSQAASALGSHQATSPRADNRTCCSALIDVLNWKAVWLEEQKRTKELPPICNISDQINAKLAYSSTEEYVKTYRPLILMEIWEDLVHCVAQENIYFHMDMWNMTVEPDGDHGTTLMRFHAVLPAYMELSDRFPCSGWMVMLSLPLISRNSSQKTTVDVLAYIESTRTMPYAEFLKSRSPSVLLERLATCEHCEKLLVNITVRTRSRKIDLKKGAIFKMALITRFDKWKQLIDGLNNIKQNSLGQALLQPKRALCMLPRADPEFEITTAGSMKYNRDQSEAIMRVTKACTGKLMNPMVALISGPPGTGKTSVIRGIISELIQGANVTEQTKPHILLCAPSNTALDEAIRIVSQQSGIRLVRVGPMDDNTDESIRRIHLDSHVRKNVHNDITLKMKSLRNIIAGQNGSRHDVEKAKKDIARLESRRQAYLNGTSKPNPAETKQKRDAIVFKADVIATTLTNCMETGMEVLLKYHKRPIICIVDEATQCTEPDLLLLLRYGFNRLVLVGDQHQLTASIRSQKARKLGFQMSLFERLYRNVSANDGAVIKLTTQYRMHADIYEFPSMYYYRGSLNANRHSASFSKLAPYVVFNVKDSVEKMHADLLDYSNRNESNFIARLVEVVLQNEPTSKIGILTYYAAQRTLLQKAINERIKVMGLSSSVEVKTVEGFQGREKDVMIVSTVRAQSAARNIGILTNPNLMNVAITRARSALFICGHRASLQVCSNWNTLMKQAERRHQLFDVSSDATEFIIDRLVQKN